MHTVSVIIPAYNEEERLGKTLQSLKGISHLLEIIVVDDGSSDGTSDVAKQEGVHVVRLEKNQGKGAALRAGFEESKGNIILMLDADLEESAAEAQKLLQPVLEGKADMVIAAFPPAKTKGGFGMVKGLSRWGIRRLTGLDMKTPLSGQRAMRREILEKIRLEDGFGLETALTIDATRAGFKIVEVETNMRHRESDRTLRGFLHRGKQLRAVAFVLIKRLLWLNQEN